MHLRRLACVFLLVVLTGCSISKVPQNLSYGFLNQDDLVTVEQGLPSYLLLVDGLLETYPESTSLLQAASTMNSAYAGLFVQDEQRAARLYSKSLDLAFRAVCSHHKPSCDLSELKFKAFKAKIDVLDRKKDIAPLYILGTSWASYVQHNKNDWAVIADLAKVQYIFERLQQLDEGYDSGMVHVYLGAMNSLVPPALGGKPEIARAHFERAIELSEGRNLVAKLMYAQQYARLLYERELHDRLLQEVLAADPHAHGLTLANVYAQQEAKKLLADADDYF